MTHPRTNIRQAVAQQLQDNIQNVTIFKGRAIPIFDQDIPAILVYTDHETIKEERWDTDGCGELTRELDLFVEAIDIGKDELDDKLDELAQQIEQALDGWTVPDKKNAVLRFAETNTSHDIMGDKIYGAVQLRYTLTYMTETHHNHD